MKPRELAGTILVVEDEPDLREFIMEVFAGISARVLGASDGRDALLTLERESVHAVISDIHMPRMTGIELLKEARARGDLVPFVFVTGYKNEHNMMEALRHGALEFIEKPFEVEQVLGAASRALALGMVLREVQAAERSAGAPKSAADRMRTAALLLGLERSLYTGGGSEE